MIGIGFIRPWPAARGPAWTRARQFCQPPRSYPWIDEIFDTETTEAMGAPTLFARGRMVPDLTDWYPPVCIYT